VRAESSTGNLILLRTVPDPENTGGAVLFCIPGIKKEKILECGENIAAGKDMD
jgi:hypothetical protein